MTKRRSISLFLVIFLALTVLLAPTTQASPMNGRINFKGRVYLINDSCNFSDTTSVRSVKLTLEWVAYAYFIVKDKILNITMDGYPAGNGPFLDGTFPLNNGCVLQAGYVFGRLNKKRKTSALRQIYYITCPDYSSCGFTYSGRVRG